MIKPQLAGLQAMCAQKHAGRLQVCVGDKTQILIVIGQQPLSCDVPEHRETHTHTCESSKKHTCQQPLAHSCRYCTVGGLLTVQRRLERERERRRWGEGVREI